MINISRKMTLAFIMLVMVIFWMRPASTVFVIHVALFSSSPTEAKDISIMALFALKSAKLHGKPDELRFYYNGKLPVGPNFNEARKFVDHFEKVEVPTEIFGNKIENLSHAKDVFQLEILQKYGGVFIDMDVIVLKDLRHLYQSNNFVMGRQKNGNLVSAFVASKKDSFFLDAWYKSYTTFDDKVWSYHSGIIPRRLAANYSNEIKVLTAEEFAIPGFDNDGFQMAFLDREYNYSSNYATHLWSHMAGSSYLQNKLTENKIVSLDNSLFCLIRKLQLLSINSGKQLKIHSNFNQKQTIKKIIVSEKCSLLNKIEHGVIGNWSRMGEHLPKIKDFSEVGYHGHLSPLAGFEAVNSTAIFKGNRNGILQLRGDHIFLPVLSGTYSDNFNLTMEVAFPVAASTGCTIIALSIGNSLSLNLQHEGASVRTFKFSLKDGENVVQNQEIEIDEKIVNNKIVNVNFEGKDNGSIIFMLENPENDFLHTETIQTKFKRRQQLKGIWLGTQRQYLKSLKSFPVGCFYDIKSLSLSR